jgi:peptidoglycan hydrolase-like protein with peptidoglycan-binding domain
MRGVDCATRVTPDVAAMLKAQGIQAVGRYLGYHTKRWSKTLTPDEVRAIHGAGLSIFSIWESNPTHTEYFSYSRGVSDAQIACTEAKFIGQPKGTAIYFTVDCDATEMKPILEYFCGVQSAMHPDYRIGAYGPYRVLVALAESATPPDFYYQTYAWSNGRLFHKVNLYQYENDVHLYGLDVDKDALFTRIGAWPEVSVERPSSHPTLQQGMCGQDVQDLQVDLLYLGYSIVGAADGIFGPHTLLGVKSFQRDHRLPDDGIVDDTTWHAIDSAVAVPRVPVKPGPAPRPPKPVPRPPVHEAHPPKRPTTEEPVAASTDQSVNTSSASDATLATTWLDALKNLSQTKNIVSLTLTLLGALKIILEAFGLHVISDQQINDIANGAAAVCTIAGVLLSHNRPQNDNHNASSS